MTRYRTRLDHIYGQLREDAIFGHGFGLFRPLQFFDACENRGRPRGQAFLHRPSDRYPVHVEALLRINAVRLLHSCSKLSGSARIATTVVPCPSPKDYTAQASGSPPGSLLHVSQTASLTSDLFVHRIMWWEPVPGKKLVRKDGYTPKSRDSPDPSDVSVV